MRPKSDRVWEWCFRLLLAVILLTAAGLKAYQLATTPSLGTGFLNARWLNILVVEFELFFGIWLIFGMFPQLTWLASVVLFIVFASVSFYKVAIGADSCGCFGAVAVNPWYTFAFDVSVVITLLGCRPSKTGSMTQVQGWISFVFSWLILVLPVSYLLISYQSAQLTSDGVIHGNGMVLLSPEEWVSTHFSLSKHIQMYEKQSLFQGPWKVLLYRNQCEQCHQVIEDWKHADSANSQIAVISVPDVSETVSVSSSFPEHWLQGQLDSQISWAVTTPVVLILNDGIVHHVNVGEACFNRTE